MAIDENKDVEHDNYLRLIVMQRVIQFNRQSANIIITGTCNPIASVFRICVHFEYVENSWVGYRAHKSIWAPDVAIGE